MSIHVFLSVICLSVLCCLSMSIYLSVGLSVCPCFHPSICLSVYLSIIFISVCLYLNFYWSLSVWNESFYLYILFILYYNSFFDTLFICTSLFRHINRKYVISLRWTTSWSLVPALHGRIILRRSSANSTAALASVSRKTRSRASSADSQTDPAVWTNQRVRRAYQNKGKQGASMKHRWMKRGSKIKRRERHADERIWDKLEEELREKRPDIVFSLWCFSIISEQ